MAAVWRLLAGRDSSPSWVPWGLTGSHKRAAVGNDCGSLVCWYGREYSISPWSPEKYWLLSKEDALGGHEEGGVLMMPLPGWGSRHCPPQGRWAPCRANAAPLAPWPSNNAPLNGLGYNLPHSCVARRAFVFSPHLEEIFLHLERTLHFPHTLFSYMVQPLENKDETTSPFTLLFLIREWMLTQACLAGLPSTCLLSLFLTREAFFQFFDLLRSLPSQSPCPECLLSSPLPHWHLFIRQTSGLSWHFLLDLEIRPVSHTIWFYRSRYYSCRVFSMVVILYFVCHYWV